MTAQTPQTLYDSQEDCIRSAYSSGDDVTADTELGNPLVDRLLSLEKGLLEAVEVAKAGFPSQDEAYDKWLREAQDNIEYLQSRREYHKKVGKLMRRENESLKKELDGWKAKTNNLQEERKAAQERARNLFG